jgi:hypothetical protein
LAITSDQIAKVVTNVFAKAKEHSAKVNHNDWWPCGFASLRVSGRSPIVTALKKNPSTSLYCRPAYGGGYSISVRYPSQDAYECQNMNFAIKVHEILLDELKPLGVEGYVDSRID